MIADVITDIRKHCRRCARTTCVEKGGNADLRFFEAPGECWNFRAEEPDTTDRPLSGNRSHTTPTPY